MIDLRSDTVTKPTTAMLEAMLSAKVGDDVFGDDPSINSLEANTAAMFGKEAALFCPSGTMTNQIAIKVHTRQGDQVICEQGAHIYNYEGGGIAANSGASVKLLDGELGRITAEQVEEAINGDDPHLAKSTLVAIENTSNRGGGSCYDKDQVELIAQVCKLNGLKFHLDGARLFNALVANDEHPLVWGSHFDSISICLSKGLGAPVGSLLIGSKEFIHEARRVRKRFGGGMRQAGYLAAAGAYALENNIDRLAEDHARAKKIAEVLEAANYIEEVFPVETNILIARLKVEHPVEEFLKTLEEQEILAVKFGPQTFRFVTHLDFDDRMLESLIKFLSEIK